MQDEVNEKTIALYIKTGKLTAQTLQKAMKAILSKGKKQLADRGLFLLCQLLCGKLLKGCGQSVRVPPLEKDEITGRRFGAVFL